MPAIVLFGRRWLIASDDFGLMASLDLGVKFCWLIASFIYYWGHEGQSVKCVDEAYYLRIYLYGLIFSLAVIIMTDFMVLKITLRGAIMDIKSRQNIVIFIYLRIFFEVLDIGWNILGSIWAFGPMLNCEDSPGFPDFVRRYTICNWISIIILTLLLIFHYDPLGSKKLDWRDLSLYEKFEPDGTPIPMNAKFWDKRSRIFMCFCLPTRSRTINEGFKEVGKLFGYLFRGEDLVPMDIIAGFIALYLKPCKEPQDQPEINGNHITENPLEKVDSNERYNEEILESKSKEQIFMLHHFLKFIDGSYGLFGYLCGSRPISSLFKEMICCGIIRSSDVIQGDNICSCNTSAIKVVGKEQGILTEDDIVFVTFENRPFVVPFYVALDHVTKSIVVVVRGTLSYPDLVTDLTGLPVQMNNIPGVPKIFRAHHGFLLTAENVRKKLKKNGILERAKNSHPDYNVVFLGQSLGAAVAIICGIMYHKEFPTLKVYSISPPGGLLNTEATDFVESFVTSVVYGDDVIARTSIPGLHQLKLHIVRVLHQVRTPKSVLLNRTWAMFAGHKVKLSYYKESDEEFRLKEIEIQDKISKTVDLEAGKDSSSVSNLMTYPMYVPGRILHITETPRWARGERDCPRWTMKWAHRNEFMEIVVSPRMYKDHWHFRMVKALREFVHLTNDDCNNPSQISISSSSTADSSSSSSSSSSSRNIQMPNPTLIKSTSNSKSNSDLTED